MEEQFNRELNNAINRVQDALAPYTRFVRSEQEKTNAMRGRVNSLDTKLLALRNAIDNLSMVPVDRSVGR